jgi:hypothetical protein
MPGLNRKGPLKKGPMTGEKRDTYKDIEADKTNQRPDTTEDVIPGQGRGLGQRQGGLGRGVGKGQCRGQARGGRGGRGGRG